MDTTAWFPIAGVLSAGVVAVIAIYILALRFGKFNLPGGDMVRKKKDAAAVLGVALLAIALMGGAWTEMSSWAGQAQASITGEETEDTDELSDYNCDSDGLVTTTIDVQNFLNDASLEEFDVTMTCVGPGNVFSYADTTDPTADTTHFVCGDTYTCAITSTAGAAGDGSVVKAILAGGGSIVDGNFKFTAKGAAQSFQLDVPQRGVAGFRSYDVKQSAWMYDETGDNTTSAYETDGVTFCSTTNNATAIAVGTAGEVHTQLYFRSTAVDEALNDGRGLLVAFEGSNAVWDTPTVKIDGVTLSDCKASLTSNEAIALSAYEHVYCYNGDKAFSMNAEGVLDFNVFALAGVDPSTDLELDLIPRGQEVSSLDSTKMVSGGYDDAATHAVILQVEDVTYDIS